mmetsp:Transcript_5030/g.10165  ORF Transcript_5030/g.10165 Transcript_5030/m.10165 type:complete len:166 (-) Transcript_5030:195-692(-)
MLVGPVCDRHSPKVIEHGAEIVAQGRIHDMFGVGKVCRSRRSQDDVLATPHIARSLGWVVNGFPSALVVDLLDSTVFAGVATACVVVARTVRKVRRAVGDCPGCCGSGYVTCRACQGRGFHWRVESPQGRSISSWFVHAGGIFCWECHGNGDQQCVQCGGTGYMY